MEQLEKASENYLLEASLENLHAESTRWISQIELWKRELSFFQKLLDNNSSKFTSEDDKKKEDHFQNLIIYYNGELLDEYKQLTRRHEKYLAEILRNEENVSEAEYRSKHNDIKNKIEGFADEFRKYKHDFFSLIETVI